MKINLPQKPCCVNSVYMNIVDRHVTQQPTIKIVVSTEKLLRERATGLRYTYTAYPVKFSLCVCGACNIRLARLPKVSVL